VTPETGSYIAIAGLVIAAIAMLLAIWLVLRTRNLARMGAFRPQMPADLQDAVERESHRLDQLTSRVDDALKRLPIVESRSSLALQRVGIVRFNPFEDTGGQQSFAVALLDSAGTGFVISSLHSRQATRVYLKQITTSKSDAQMSDEETEAIRRALAGDTSEAALSRNANRV
jgi:hypothetical protein